MLQHAALNDMLLAVCSKQEGLAVCSDIQLPIRFNSEYFARAWRSVKFHVFPILSYNKLMYIKSVCFLKGRLHKYCKAPEMPRETCAMSCDSCIKEGGVWCPDGKVVVWINGVRYLEAH